MPSKAEIKRMKKHAAKSRIKGKSQLLRGGSRTGGGLPKLHPKKYSTVEQDLFELGLEYDLTLRLKCGSKDVSGSDTIGQLIQKTEKELLSIFMVGPVSLKKIKAALFLKNLFLKNEVSLLEQDIGELGLDKEITFILRLGNRYIRGSSTIGQLIQKTEEEVLSLLRIGLVSLKKIKTALSEKGLALKALRKF